MSAQRWIVIRNWERFQHYRDREPPWVKNYTALLSDPNYGGLSHAQRSTLHGLWLMYARSSRQIPDDTAWITRQLGVRVTRATLEALNHAGFLEFTLANRYQDASPRAQAERHIDLKQEQELRTYERPLATKDENHDDENLSTIDYEDLLKTITGVESMELSEVPLTPSQLAEVSDLESEHVRAWLDALADPPDGITNPVGWFLAGVRSGLAPAVAQSFAVDRAQARAVHVAEAWIRNVGAIVAEHEMFDELFGEPLGVLRHWRDDQALRARMLERWQVRQHVGTP